MECPECGDHAVILESHFVEEHVVCQACGAVLESGSFQQDHKQYGGDYVSQRYTGRPNNFKGGIRTVATKAPAYKEGWDVMENMMSLLGLPDDLMKRAKMIYEQIKYFSRPTVAAAAVYIVVKQSGRPITLRYLANFLNVSYFNIGEMVRTICLRLGLELKNVLDMKDFVPLILKDGNFVNIEGICEKEKMLDRTVEIVNLCNDNLVLTGGDPNLNMIASAFVAWKSLEPRFRKKKRFREFLDVANIKMSNTISVVAKSKVIEKFFLTLSSHIPWNSSSQSLDRYNIYFHMPEILQYQHQLVRSEVVHQNDGKSERKKTKPNDHSTGYLKLYRASRKKNERKKKKTNCKQNQTTICSTTHDLFSTDLTEEDLPESELRFFIRSPEEVENVAALYSKNNDC